jgi:hypothetical protein
MITNYNNPDGLSQPGERRRTEEDEKVPKMKKYFLSENVRI